ncbi:MAG: DUF4350 domain-containing protein [Acidobacteriota bacterium]
MKRAWLWGALSIAIIVVGVLLADTTLEARASTLTRSAGGWAGMHAVLTAWRAEVEIVDEPADRIIKDDDPDGLWVVALPLQRRPTRGALDALAGWARRGGTLVLAYSGLPELEGEARVLGSFGLDIDSVRDWPPLAPRAWWRHRTATWTIDWPGFRAAEIEAPSSLPEPPSRATILARGGPDQRPVAFTWPLGRGQVLVVPAALWSNAWVDEAGNADLLAAVHGRYGPRWRFDEYHHGLASSSTSDAALSRHIGHVWDLLTVHLLGLWLLAVWALGRAFGPAWRASTVRGGSSTGFLVAVGAFHRRLGHHRQAAQRLAERVRRLDPDCDSDALTTLDDASAIRSGDELLAAARELAASRKR